MTIAVTKLDYSLIDVCTTAANWTGSTPAAVTDFPKEGTTCIGFTMKTSGTNDSYLSGTWNLAGKHLHLWFMTAALKEMSSVQISLYDGTNTGYYTILTTTTYPGGWFNAVINCDMTPSSGTQPTLTAITRIGIRMTLSIAAKNQQNTWVDHVYTGSGLQISSDATFTLADILSWDENTTNGMGMMRRIGGVYYLVGSLVFGVATGTTACTFADTSQVIVFEDRPVSTSVYKIEVLDNGTGTTSFTLGSLSGTTGISGCIVRVQSLTQTAKYDLVFNNTNVDNVKLYGSTFLDADSTTLPADATNVKVLNCNFESCGTVECNTASFEYCNFISANSIGAKLTTASHKLKNSNFISCAYGIEITISSASFPLDNVKFSSNTKDIYYTAATGNLTIGLTNGANASTFTATGTGTVYFSNDIAVKVYVYNQAGAVIVGANVAVYKTSDSTEIMNEATDSGGLAETTYNLSGDTPVVIRIRKSSTGGTRYFPAETSQTLTGNFRLDWTLQSDQIASA